MKPAQIRAFVAAVIENPERAFDDAEDVPLEHRTHGLWLHLIQKLGLGDHPVATLNAPQRHLLATMDFDRKVYRGGIVTTIHNSGSISEPYRVLPYVVTGFVAISASRHAAVAQAVMTHPEVQDWIAQGQPRPFDFSPSLNDMTKDYTDLDMAAPRGRSFPEKWLHYAADNRALALTAP